MLSMYAFCLYTLYYHCPLTRTLRSSWRSSGASCIRNRARNTTPNIAEQYVCVCVLDTHSTFNTNIVVVYCLFQIYFSPSFSFSIFIHDTIIIIFQMCAGSLIRLLARSFVFASGFILGEKNTNTTIHIRPKILIYRI